MDTSRTSMIKFYSQPGGSQSSEGGSDTFKKLYCTRQMLRITECMNTSVLDCAVTFTCDKNVCLYGIQVGVQVFFRVLCFIRCFLVDSCTGFDGHCH